MKDGVTENVNNNLHEYDEQNDTVQDSASSELENEAADTAASDEIDYEAVVKEDLKILREEFSELSEITDICELDNPLRYAALRDLGLSPAEAYLATAKRSRKDNRSHLVATRTVSLEKNGTMSDAELASAREIFSNISDREIRKLYKRVTK